MRVKQSIAEVVDAFSSQFEVDGENYVYREGRRAAPVRVSAAERESYIKRFERHYRRQLGWFAAALCIITLLYVGWVVLTDGEVVDWHVYVGIGGLTLGLFIWNRHLWRLPSRELERRPRVGEGRTASEARRYHNQRISWLRLSLGFIVGGLLVVDNLADPETSEHGRTFWLALAAVLIALFSWSAISKWRDGTRDDA